MCPQVYFRLTSSTRYRNTQKTHKNILHRERFVYFLFHIVQIFLIIMLLMAVSCSVVISMTKNYNNLFEKAAKCTRDIGLGPNKI